MWYYTPATKAEIDPDAITELSLFTGNSGFGLLARLLFPAIRTVCYVEHECHQAATLVARIQDKALDDAPVASRVESFNGRPFRGCVDILTASMPCTPHSVAGAQRDIKDARWLWRPTRRIINQARPRAIFMENVLGFKRVLPIVRPQLEALGYRVDVQVVSAAEVGASHLRRRIWLLAYADSNPPRVEPWWGGREGRSDPPEHCRGRSIVEHSGRLGEREPDPESRPLSRGDSRRAALVAVSSLDDSDGLDGRRRGGQAGHLEAPGRGRPSHADEEVGNAEGADEQGQGESGSGQVSYRGPGGGMGNSHGAGPQERESVPRDPREELAPLERAIAEMGYAYGGRFPTLEECYGQQTHADRETSHRRNAFGSGLSLFPPGRSEGERRCWAQILERDLGVCPALPKSEIRGMAHGTSGYVDQCRSVGRGLVPLAGAYAMLFMFARAGLVGPVES